jgi:hypothetical protein
MLEWLKNLELEFVIIFALLAIVVISLIVLLIKAQRTLNLIGRRALILTEDLVTRDGKDVVDILVANSSYVNVEAAAIGLIYQKTLLPLKEENTIVLARDSFKLSLPLSELRSYVLGDGKKVKKIRIYVEDSLGRRSFRLAINSMIKLRKILKAEKKALKKEEKIQRFETGHYRFFERLGLIIALIFSPITKLFRSIKTGINRKLKRRELRLELKRKEQEHQTMLREIAEEERREEERSNQEKRLMEEKKKANIDARLAALKRKEEERKAQEELRKSEEELKTTEEEIKVAEAEAELHDEKNQVLDTEEKQEIIEEPTEKTEMSAEEIVDEVEEVKLDNTETKVENNTSKKKKTQTKSKSKEEIDNEENKKEEN